MAARVKSLITGSGHITGVTLDAEVAMENGKNYAIRFRKSDGSSLVLAVHTAEGSGKDILLSVPVATADGPAEGDLALFGEAGTESVELIVKAIIPQGDLAARITCVDAAPAVHTADTLAIPAFDSQITTPVEMQRPPTPVLSQIQSGEESLIRNTDGSLTTRIIVTLKAPSFGGKLTAEGLIRAKDETQFRAAQISTQAQNSLSIVDVAEGETYDIQIRYVTDGGVYSAPLLITGHRVEGTSALPSDVADFSINVLGDTAHLSWDAVTDLDLDHYNLRFSPQLTGATWSGAVDIVSSIARDATSVTVPAASGSYLLKAVDVGGLASANAAAAVTSTDGTGQNAILTLTESPGFTGDKTGTAASAGALQLSGNDSIDDWGNIDTVANIDIGNDGLAVSGSYAFAGAVDLGASYTSRLTADLSVAGIDLNASLDTWGDIDTVEFFDQDVDPSLWSLQLQLRTTNDNPVGSPAWSGWMPFVVGDYTARAFQFRALLESAADNITPSLSALAVDVDMPDRIFSGRSIASEAAGTSISFPNPFRATPAITVTPRDMTTGDYYAITAPSESGFNIRFFNSGGSGISRTFDYLARGYGEQV